jgi:DNA primase
MPGIDFNRLRREITMEEVLNLLSFEPLHRAGDQWSGRCPLHESKPGRQRHFSVNVGIRRYQCHKCGSKGNQLELWQSFTKLQLHAAMIDLCGRLGREVPWIRRW